MRLKRKTPKETDDVISSPKIDYSEGWAYVNIRMPNRLLRQIDKHLNKQSAKTFRTHWIMDAITEKLEREK